MNRSICFKFVVVTISFLIAVDLLAQPGAPVKDVDFLEKQKKVMTEYYPHLFSELEINDVEKINSRQSKVFYTRNNKNYETIVNSNRKDLLIIASCEEIPVTQLPDIVQQGFHNSKLGNKKIEKAFIVTTPYSSNFYRIDVYPSDKKKHYKSIFFDKLGKYRKPPY